MMKQKSLSINLISGLIGIILICLMTGGYPVHKEGMIYPSDTLCSKITFVSDSSCFIEDPANCMLPFYSLLKELKEGKDTVLHIVHLGDSHIQAGFFTGCVMRLLHGEFGNGGRGWIAPFKITKTNEPTDYFISSQVKEWGIGRVIQSATNRKAPIGLGGVGIHTAAASVNFNVGVTPVNGAGYAFNQVVLYRGAGSMPMLPTVSQKDFVQVSTGVSALTTGLITDTFYIDTHIDTLRLQSTRKLPGSETASPASSFQNVYYGFNLLSGNPGIVYHSVGVNGAMFVNYTQEEYVRQLATLNPSLLIISLGTNETFGRRFNGAEFEGQVNTLIQLVKRYMPEATLMLTTPPECFKSVTVDKKRIFVRNDNTEIAAKTIRNVAFQNNIACWDLYQLSGGKNSSSDWFKGKWMGKDRIHFNKEGYYEQGVLFFKSLTNSFYSAYPRTEEIISKE